MELEQTRDTVVRKLTSTTGADLEIMANLRDRSQISAVMEGLVNKMIGDKVGIEEYETLLKMTISWQGRGRDDLREIGKTPDRGFSEKEEDD